MLGGLGAGADFQLLTEEQTRFAAEFAQLPSSGGKVSADTARTFFMRSGLPTQVLGKIWALSDDDKDGQLTVQEFAVAMKLVRMGVARQNLPMSIPKHHFGSSHLGNDGMGMNPTFTGIPQQGFNSYQPIKPILTGPARTYQAPMVPLGGSPMTPTSTALSSLNPSFSAMGLNLDLSFGQKRPQSASTSSQPSQPLTTQPMTQQIYKRPHDWTITPTQRSKLNQQFNQNDRNKSGFLEGMIARSILLPTGLPPITLGKVWTLADQDQDGRLSRQEFVAAMSLCEAAKNGVSIPETLPPELAGAAPLGKPAGAPKSFEDERRANLEKGMQELERRREAIRASQEAERQEAERRRREEEEERERKREEIERKRLEDEERQRRLMEEEARKRQEEAERQYKIEIEKKRQEMLTEKKRIEETLSRMRHQRDQLIQEHEASLEKERDTRKRRDEISMRLQGANDSLNGITNQVSRTKAEVQSMDAQLMVSKHEVERIRTRKFQVEEQLTEKQRDHDYSDITRQCESAQASLNDTRETSRKHRVDMENEMADKEESIEKIKKMNEMLGRDPYDGLPEELKPKVVHQPSPSTAFGFGNFVPPSSDPFVNAPHVQPSSGFGASDGVWGGVDFNQKPSEQAGWGAWGNEPINPTPAQSTALRKYIASFDFSARSPDELTFRDGDEIDVDLAHLCEPEWLFGHLNGQSGLFPQAYASPIEDTNHSSAFTPAITNGFGELSIEPAPPVDVVLETVTAAHPFMAVEEKHMSFAAGSTIEILEKQDEWCRGRLTDGTVGWFPKTYATTESPKKQPKRNAPMKPGGSQKAPIPTENVGIPFIASYDFHGQEKSDLSFSAGETVRVIRQDGEWWDGINAAGKSGMFPSAYVEDPSGLAASPIIVTAQFDYDGTSPDDLSFHCGDKITVIDRTDPSWWTGRLETGASGVFPSNYVTDSK